jgi:methyltransferase NSUN6
MDVTLVSLDDLKIGLSESVYEHLLATYHKIEDEAPADHLERIMDRMKRPPATCIFRVNQLMTTPDHVVSELHKLMQEWVHESSVDGPSIQYDIARHAVFADVVEIVIHPDSAHQSLSHCTKPPKDNLPLIYPNWPKRKLSGFPLTHKVIICDRFCGEAVLRGSSIFVKGILAADVKIAKDDTLAVYADIRDSSVTTRINRGMILDQYKGTAVFLGVGKAACDRAEMFSQQQGLGVIMSVQQRAGPILPPLSGRLQHLVHLQNLPSILVAHALDPQPGDVIFDMCAAPGGKTMHLASLVHNKATIVASDKSRKKMVTASSVFESAQCTCITPLALDSAHCVDHDAPPESWKSVKEVCFQSSLVPCCVFAAPV